MSVPTTPADLLKGTVNLLLKETSPTTSNGFHSFGNIVDPEIDPASDFVEHMTARDGVLVPDKRSRVARRFAMAFGVDEFGIQNMRYALFGDTDTAFTQASASVTDQAVTLYHDLYVELGKYMLSNVVVTNVGDTVTYVEGTDYEVDTAAGLLMAINGGAISDAGSVEVDYDHAAIAQRQFAEKSTNPIIEGLGRLIIFGDDGKKFRLSFPKLSIAVDGTLGVNAEDFSNMRFRMEALKSGNSALYTLEQLAA
tara:strand:+ start:149 stop:907 length:759 start_codon:yes stop_codon:yes gene_type:complete